MSQQQQHAENYQQPFMQPQIFHQSPIMDGMVPQEDWFTYITGVTEEGFREIGVGSFICSPAATPSGGNKGFPLQIKNFKTGRVFDCGTFDVTSVGDLVSAYKSRKHSVHENLCKFKIVAASDPENSVCHSFVFIQIFLKAVYVCVYISACFIMCVNTFFFFLDFEGLC